MKSPTRIVRGSELLISGRPVTNPVSVSPMLSSVNCVLVSSVDTISRNRGVLHSFAVSMDTRVSSRNAVILLIISDKFALCLCYFIFTVFVVYFTCLFLFICLFICLLFITFSLWSS